MKLISKMILSLILLSNCLPSFASENLFYTLRSTNPDNFIALQNAYTSLVKHWKSIDILVSQAYQVDKDGFVWGFTDSAVKNFTQQHHIKLLVLVTNAKFNTQDTH